MKQRTLAVVLCSILLLGLAAIAGAGPKNVILMISDGWSYQTVDATNYWHGTTQAYQGSGWVHYAMTTYSANNPAGYNPAQAWISDGMGGYKPNIPYLKTGATDSASAITAMATGIKIFDGQINYATDQVTKLKTITEYYKEWGGAAGSVSTVHWTHATPAGMGSHSLSRDAYDNIANEMIYQSGLDVIMGAGHPFYNNDGNYVAPTSTSYKRVGGQATWEQLVNGQTDYTLITDRSQFQALANGSLTASKVCGTFKAATTAQQSRSGYSSTDVPGSVPFNPNVPTLAEMAIGALNVLKQNTKGYVAMFEGGAVDWANHANQAARMIEEQTDFNMAVDAVIAWIEQNSSWNETLLIVTGDHGCGMITGPNGETFVVDNGPGVMPGMKYNYTSHTNELIPLFAKGAGSELFAQYATGLDPVRGAYIDNTDVFKVMMVAGNTVPEPSSLLAFFTGATGIIGVIIRRRK